MFSLSLTKLNKRILTKRKTVDFARLHHAHLKDDRGDNLKNPLFINPIFWALLPNIGNLYWKFSDLFWRQLEGKIASTIKEENVTGAGHPKVLLANDLQGRLADLSNGFVVLVVCWIVKLIKKFKMLVNEESEVLKQGEQQSVQGTFVGFYMKMTLYATTQHLQQTKCQHYLCCYSILILTKLQGQFSRLFFKRSRDIGLCDTP